MGAPWLRSARPLFLGRTTIVLLGELVANVITVLQTPIERALPGLICNVPVFLVWPSLCLWLILTRRVGSPAGPG